MAGANGSFGGLRREINWDGVPDAFSAPNNMPSDFFNVNSPRGAVFSTPGTGFQVSANAGIAPIHFDNIDPAYSQTFEPFSPQRLFTSLGSNIVDVDFFVPGTNTPASTNGFGAIFSDVDLANTTSIELTFDLTGLDPSTASISGLWATDNEGSDILLNGQSAGNKSVGFTAFTSFSIPPGSLFVSGLNTLDFLVHNDRGPTGLRVEMTGQASPVGVPDSSSTLTLLSVSVGALLVACRRIKKEAALVV